MGTGDIRILRDELSKASRSVICEFRRFEDNHDVSETTVILERAQEGDVSETNVIPELGALGLWGLRFMEFWVYSWGEGLRGYPVLQELEVCFHPEPLSALNPKPSTLNLNPNWGSVFNVVRVPTRYKSSCWLHAFLRVLISARDFGFKFRAQGLGCKGWDLGIGLRV